MIAIVIVVLVVLALAAPVFSLAPAEPPPPSTVPTTTVPSSTVDDFYPESAELSDCIGALERPGCGSRSRGGWRQTLVFVAVAGGIAAVFGRLAYAARKHRRVET